MPSLPLLRRNWLLTFLTLCVIGIFTGVLGGDYVLRKARAGFLATLMLEKERKADVLVERFRVQLAEGHSTHELLGSFQYSLQLAPADDTAFVCVFDQDARVLAHPNPAMIGMHMAEAPAGRLGQGLNETLLRRLRGAPHTSLLKTPDFGETPHLVLQVPVPETEWVLSLHSELGALEERMEALTADLTRAGVPILLFFVVAGTIGTRRVERIYESRLEAANASLETTVRERTATLEETLEALSIAKLAAESADRLKGEFLSLMSHEYRTPLNGILGMADLIHTDPDATAELQACALDISSSGHRLLRLIERVLEFAAIEGDQNKPDLETVDLYAWLHHLVSEVSRLHQRSTNGVSVTLAQGLSVIELAPLAWWSRIVAELLDNAIKFSPGDAIEIAASLAASDSALHLFICDDGPGIPAHLRETNGKLFTQGDGSSSRQHEGIGLGLIMASRITSKLGGTLTLSAGKNGAGTCVSLELPVRVVRK